MRGSLATRVSIVLVALKIIADTVTKSVMGFKAFYSAQATIEGIETAHMIRNGQLSAENIPVYKQFMALAG